MVSLKPTSAQTPLKNGILRGSFPKGLPMTSAMQEERRRFVVISKNSICLWKPNGYGPGTWGFQALAQNCMNILTPFQSAFLKAFSQTPLNARFYLTGGTALSAFYLQHRLSEDLDFFTAEPDAIREVPETLARLAKIVGYTLQVERSLPAFFDWDVVSSDGTSTKIDFAVDSPFRLKPLVRNGDYGIQIDDALDIYCNKLSALFDRAEAKDFVDVYFILKERFAWNELLENAQKKHVGLEPHLLAKAFLRVQDIKFLPRLVKPLDMKTLQNFFLDLARQLMDQLKA